MVCSIYHALSCNIDNCLSPALHVYYRLVMVALHISVVWPEPACICTAYYPWSGSHTDIQCIQRGNDSIAILHPLHAYAIQ